MRILYSHRIQSRDGQSVHLEELIAAFRAEGHEVMVVGPSFYEQSEFGGESRMVALVRKLLPDAAKEMAELAYNVPMYGVCARPRRRSSPTSSTNATTCITWPAHGSPGHRAALLCRGELAAREERIKFGRLRLARLAYRSERAVWSAATRVLAVTQVFEGDHRGERDAAERVAVVCNGNVLERFPPRPARPAAGALTIGFVGFVRDWHGMDALIDAMAGTPAQASPGRRRRRSVRPALEAQAARLGWPIGPVHRCRAERRGAVWVATFDVALQPKVTSYASR